MTKKTNAGFSILMLLISVGVILIMALILLKALSGKKETTNGTTTEKNTEPKKPSSLGETLGTIDLAKENTKKTIMQIEQAITMYEIDFGKYPDTLNQVVERGYLTIESIKDGWNNEIVYIRGEGKKGYRLISYGKDGKPGGEDANSDITND